MALKVVELGPAEMMLMAETLATMLVQVKKNPVLIRLIPDEHELIIISIIEMMILRANEKEPSDVGIDSVSEQAAAVLKKMKEGI